MKLRLCSRGASTAEACRRIGTSAQTYFRWREKCGGLKTDDELILQETAKETSKPRAAATLYRSCLTSASGIQTTDMAFASREDCGCKASLPVPPMATLGNFDIGARYTMKGATASACRFLATSRLASLTCPKPRMVCAASAALTAWSRFSDVRRGTRVSRIML